VPLPAFSGADRANLVNVDDLTLVPSMRPAIGVNLMTRQGWPSRGSQSLSRSSPRVLTLGADDSPTHLLR